jgi:hypothetical protein
LFLEKFITPAIFASKFGWNSLPGAILREDVGIHKLQYGARGLLKKKKTPAMPGPE